MSFVFCYYKLPITGILNATVKPDFLESSEEEIIASYLTDNGGASLDSHIDFLNDSVKKLENTLLVEADIGSNSYGVEIYKDQAKISFLYDEDNYLVISRLKILKIMKLWISFLKKIPIENYEEKHDL